MLRITDKNFVYVSAANTDLKKRFAQIRREQKAAAAATVVVKPQTVVAIKRAGK